MTTEPIIESGMTFGPYLEGRCFQIEKSNCYAAIREHIRMAEFLYLRRSQTKPVIWVVEAKSTAPRPEAQPNFDIFIAEIREKLVNAFSIGWASCLNRHSKAEVELPQGFKTLDLAQVDVKFVLVIKGHQDKWLPPLKEALRISLRSTVKCWAFAPTSVMVLNDALAQQKGLIFSGHRDDT